MFSKQSDRITKRGRKDLSSRLFIGAPKEHLIYFLIVLGSLFCGLTTHSAGTFRFIQSVRDLGTSIAIWFLSLFDIYDVIPETILTYDFPGMVEYIGFDVPEILRKLSELFPSLFFKEYFFGYLIHLSLNIDLIAYFVLIAVPVFLIVSMVIK